LLQKKPEKTRKTQTSSQAAEPIVSDDISRDEEITSDTHQIAVV
jgi:hypothetical protein